MNEADRSRRLAAKRNNERVKLVASWLNAISIAVTGAAVVLPAIATPSFLLTERSWILILVAFGLHFMAQGALSFFRSED